MAAAANNENDHAANTLAVEGTRATAATFKNHKCIGKFVFTEDDTYSHTTADYPRLVSDETITALLGTDLGANFNLTYLVPDYIILHRLNQKYVLRWIIDSRFFPGVEEKKYKKPDFICFQSCIGCSLPTPISHLLSSDCKRANWEIYAAKVHDVIYLYYAKKPLERGKTQKCFNYAGVNFQHLLTHEQPHESEINEYNRIHSVTEISFGKHQLVCLSGADAEDEDGQGVEIAVNNRWSWRNNKFSYWAYSVVRGIKTLVLGIRDKSMILKDVQKMEIANMPRKFRWNPGHCYEFQERLMKWMKTNFNENNPKIVKKFYWSLDNPTHVHVCDIPEKNIPELMLPEWYLEEVRMQMA